MQIFKTEKKIFWINELKSWVWTFVFVTIFYFGIQLFSKMTFDNLIIGVVVLLLSKIGNTLTQYHIIEIHIDREKNQLTFLLNSYISGQKNKQYELKHASSELIYNSGLTKYFTSPYFLEILIRPKDIFKIHNRYGFSLNTLISVDKSIKSKRD